MEVKLGIRTRRKLLWVGASALSATIIGLSVGVPAAAAKPKFFAASQETACVANNNVNPFLRRNHANVMRLILAQQDAAVGAGLTCVEDAYQAGFKVYVSFQFDNSWTPRQVAAYFTQVLPTYAPYLWAVGVGNEQDLTTKTGWGQGRIALSGDGRSAGQNYRAVWNAVEPVLVKLAPRAIRVYGEFSPWSFADNQQGFASGRPRGVQAIAAHCYHTKFRGITEIPQDAAWAASKRLPLWCSEMGPGLARPGLNWVLPDSWASWNGLVSKIEAESPDLQMVGYYYYPQL